MRYREHDLARGVLEGDEEAVGLVIRWIAQVLTWPRFWSLRDDRADLLQESLAGVIASLKNEKFDPARDLQHYVQGIARHAALRAQEAARRRRGQGRAEAENADIILRVSAGPPFAETVARQEIVRRVMDGASEDCRLLMRIYFLEGKNYEEIASELGLPVGTVKSRLSRCLGAAQRALRVVVHRPPSKPPGARREDR